MGRQESAVDDKEDQEIRRAKNIAHPLHTQTQDAPTTLRVAAVLTCT